MAAKIVGVNVDADSKTVKCVPEPLVVQAGDEVQWGSFHGDITILFDGKSSPFERPDWKANRGQLSKAATVQTVPAKDYGCTVTVMTDDGRVQGHSNIRIPASE